MTETIQIIIRKSGLRLNRKVQRTSCASLQNRGKTLKFFLYYFSALFPAALVKPPRLLGARPKNAKKKVPVLHATVALTEETKSKLR